MTRPARWLLALFPRRFREAHGGEIGGWLETVAETEGGFGGRGYRREVWGLAAALPGVWLGVSERRPAAPLVFDGVRLGMLVLLVFFGVTGPRIGGAFGMVSVGWYVGFGLAAVGVWRGRRWPVVAGGLLLLGLHLPLLFIPGSWIGYRIATLVVLAVPFGVGLAVARTGRLRVRWVPFSARERRLAWAILAVAAVGSLGIRLSGVSGWGAWPVVGELGLARLAVWGFVVYAGVLGFSRSPQLAVAAGVVAFGGSVIALLGGAMLPAVAWDPGVAALVAGSWMYLLAAVWRASRFADVSADPGLPVSGTEGATA